MKKTFKIVSAVAVLSAVLALAACGNRVASRWTASQGGETMTLTFYRDGTGTMVLSDGFTDDTSYDFAYTGDATKDGTITLTASNGTMTLTISGNTLTLEGEDGDSIAFIRQRR